MGAEQSHHDNFVQGDLQDKVDYSKLDLYEKFEHSFPFSRTAIKNFELNVVNAQGDKDMITMEDMRNEFTSDAWAELKDPESEMMRVLSRYPFHAGADAFEQIDKQAIMMCGLLNCPGSVQVKAAIFYNLLQEPGLTWIAAQDKDFSPSFFKMLYLASIFVFKTLEMHNEAEIHFTEEEYEQMKERFDEIEEEFLDTIFGYEAKLDREEWEKRVVEKAPWIFSSKQVREKICGEKIRKLNEEAEAKKQQCLAAEAERKKRQSKANIKAQEIANMEKEEETLQPIQEDGSFVKPKISGNPIAVVPQESANDACCVACTIF